MDESKGQAGGVLTPGAYRVQWESVSSVRQEGLKLKVTQVVWGTEHALVDTLKEAEDFVPPNRAWRDKLIEPLFTRPTPAAADLTLQQRVEPWLLACFGAEIAADTEERNHRFLEESLELVQACGCTASEAHQLVDYVYGRPVGEKHQEAGGVMITLAALCRAQGIDMHDAGEVELARIWTMVEKIRAKQATKPKHSPLPVAASPAAAAGVPTDAEDVQRVLGYLRDGEAEIRAEKRYFVWADTMARASDLIRNLAASPVAPAGARKERLSRLNDRLYSALHNMVEDGDATDRAQAVAVLEEVMKEQRQGEQHDSSHEAAPQSSVASPPPRSSLSETDESALPRDTAMKEQK